MVQKNVKQVFSGAEGWYMTELVNDSNIVNASSNCQGKLPG